MESQGTTFNSGSEQQGERGKMWYYTFTDSFTEGTYKAIGVKTNKPSASDREAEIKLIAFF
ncbi:hypothetical protein KAR91_75705 [Candidatus Pacearchaeota archaeon]|nr:hypothetical protein [Candidatus Pacearchaeota archaeon]